MKHLILGTALSLALVTAYAEDDKKEAVKTESHEGHNHAEGETCGHGDAKVLEVKGVGHVALKHDEKVGNVTLTFTDTEKKPLKLDKAPRMNLFVAKKRVQVKTTAKADAEGVYEAKDESLKGKLDGHIAFKVDGKSHKAAINPCASGCNHDH